jgi:hypothetical protein
MEELIDLIATDGSASDVSDKIKELLYTKASDRVDSARPYVATTIFGDEDNTEDQE